MSYNIFVDFYCAVVLYGIFLIQKVIQMTAIVISQLSAGTLVCRTPFIRWCEWRHDLVITRHDDGASN